jgi:hypothetical protein
MIGGVDNAVVLTKQLFSGILGDFAELVVDVVNDAALISDGDNSRLIKRKLDVSQFLEGAL